MIDVSESVEYEGDPKGRSRGWCFTINNYTDRDENQAKAIDCQWGIYGREVAPETGTPHMQGYLYFENQKSFMTIKRMLPRANIRKARGTGMENGMYCCKDGDFELLGWGEMPQDPKDQGKKGKEYWDSVLKLAKEGKFDEIPSNLQITHARQLEAIYDKYRPMPAPRNELVDEWVVGPTGSGKTKYCWDTYPGHYMKETNKWWDGYKDQKVVCIQEWGPEHVYLANNLKQWTDHYPCRVEKKGGSLEIRPEKIVVTSNYTIEECFPEKRDQEPLKRRFKIINKS